MTHCFRWYVDQLCKQEQYEIQDAILFNMI